MNLTKIFLFVIISIPGIIFSQSNIPIGTWKSYIPFNNGIAVTQSSEKIIYGTEWAIISFDKDDDTIEELTTVEGLTDVGIATIAYDNTNEQLIIAYTSSVIDVVSGNEVIPVFSIRDNNSISGDKKIYDIYIDEKTSLAYLATGFGIVEFDLMGLEFGFSAKSFFRFNSITRFGDYLIGGSIDGTYYFDLSGNLIPDDFNNWVLLDDNAGLPVVYEAKDVNVINDQLFIATEDEVFAAGSDLVFDLVYTNIEPDFKVLFVEPETDGWMLGLRSESTRSKLVFFDQNNIFTNENNSCSNRIKGAIQDEQGRIWLADEYNFYRSLSDKTASCTNIKQNAPNTHEASEIAIKDNTVYVASGGVSDAFAYLFGRAGFFVYEDSDWSNYNQGNTPAIKDGNLLSLYAIAPHPTENKVYIGSFYEGLLEWDRDLDSFKLYNKFTNNSSLQGAIGDDKKTRISGLKFDDDGNLWIANHGTAEPLSVLTADGIWHSFDLNVDNRISDMAIDDNGRVWIVVGGTSGGVHVFDHKGTIADPLDDEQRFIGTNGTAIESGLIFCVEKDLNGDIWLGTGEGPVIFNCGNVVFDPELCTGNTQVVLQDSIPAILLATEVIRTIAIDGANRKWFGTDNGVFVQSADGETQIFHFTEENSPLYDNNINDIAYNDETGEMLIATNKGIISYRTASTGSNPFRHASKVYAFPNPVRENYFGPIAIKGLVRDANVKITDVNGRLVHQTTALGGQAIWDGKDYNGRFAVSGVYMVFSTSTDTFDKPDTFVTKILVVR